MSACAKCLRDIAGKVYSGSRCQRCYRRDLRISRGLKVSAEPVERLLSRIFVDDDGCHIYQGADNGNGYKRISVGGRGGQSQYVHRVMYEAVRGPIPPGLHIDHLCRNRACVNPDHLEAVTQAENNRRAVAANASETCGVRPTNVSRINPWLASIGVGGRNIHLGLFPTQQAALNARREAEAKWRDPERRTAIELEVSELSKGAES